LASRAAGAPPARGTRGAAGGTGHIVTRNRQGPFSEFNNIILLKSQGNEGLDEGGEGQGNYFSKKFRLEPVFLWLDRASLRFFVHPPWSQGVNFDAPITFCACSTQKVPQTKKGFHMQFPIALELFKQTFLIGSINRA
jgi:hypothetical protein